jgi:hypothetical protein
MTLCDPNSVKIVREGMRLAKTRMDLNRPNLDTVEVEMGRDQNKRRESWRGDPLNPRELINEDDGESEGETTPDH